METQFSAMWPTAHEVSFVRRNGRGKGGVRFPHLSGSDENTLMLLFWRRNVLETTLLRILKCHFLLFAFSSQNPHKHKISTAQDTLATHPYPPPMREIRAGRSRLTNANYIFPNQPANSDSDSQQRKPITSTTPSVFNPSTATTRAIESRSTTDGS